MLSDNSGPLFRGELTRRSTGHTRSNPSDSGHRHTIAVDVIDGPKQCPDHEDAEQGRPAA